jgi:hypothetical protein
MRVRTYDNIHRYQPRLIEVRGSLLWFQARYAAYAVFAVLAPIAWLLMQATGDSGASAVVNAAAIAVVLSTLVMRYVEGDLTLLGALTAMWAEALAWVGHLRARLGRDRPVTIRHRHHRGGSPA